MSTPTRSLSASLSLRANFSWMFAGHIVLAASQWGMLAMLANLGSPEMVGQFALGLTVTTPIVMFSRLQLAAAQATDARREYQFGNYFGLRLITTALSMVAIVAIVIVSGYRRETALVILAVGAAKAFESISDIFHGLLQQLEKMDYIAKSIMAKGVLSLVALGAGVYLTDSVFWGATMVALTWALVLASYDIPNAVRVAKHLPRSADTRSGNSEQRAVLRPRWEPRTLTRLVGLTLPLGFVVGLEALIYNTPGYFIERYLGEGELGIYATIAYLQRAGATVVFALGLSATPRLARYYAAGNSQAFRTLLLKLVGIGVLLGGGGVLVAFVAGREILTLLYGPEYARQSLLIWLMVAAGVSYISMFLRYGMMAARRFRIQVLLYAFTVGAEALLCFSLIPHSGLHGAAIAFVITMVIQAVGSLVIVLHALRTPNQGSHGG